MAWLGEMLGRVATLTERAEAALARRCPSR
jgi:hypothetical protein